MSDCEQAPIGQITQILAWLVSSSNNNFLYGDYIYYDAPDILYNTDNLEWRRAENTANCGILKYYDDTDMFYIFEGPDEYKAW